MMLNPLLAPAQNTVQRTTNYYPITGATLPEIHASLRQNRPWKNRLTVDGFTEWHIDWRFNVAPGDGGCRLTGFGTKTVILTTLPRWRAPTNAPAQVSSIWSNYSRALALHEAGHASVALAAAADLQKQAKAVAAAADCPSLHKALNELGQRVIADYRRRDEQYDERTRHGAAQGAALPGGRGRK